MAGADWGIGARSMDVRTIGRDFIGVRLSLDRIVKLKDSDPVLHDVLMHAIEEDRRRTSVGCERRRTAKSEHALAVQQRVSCLGDGCRMSEKLSAFCEEAWAERSPALRKKFARLAIGKELNEKRKRVIMIARDLTSVLSSRYIPDGVPAQVAWLAQGLERFYFGDIDV